MEFERDELVGTMIVYCNNEVLSLSAFPNLTLIVSDLPLILRVMSIEFFFLDRYHPL